MAAPHGMRDFPLVLHGHHAPPKFTDALMHSAPVPAAPARPQSAGPGRRSPGQGGQSYRQRMLHAGGPRQPQQRTVGGADITWHQQSQQLSEKESALALSPGEAGGDALATLSVAESRNRAERPSSARRPGSARSAAPPAGAGRAAGRDNPDVTCALMTAVLQVYEHRNSPDIWAKVLEPLRALVPCEEVKAVVKSIGPPPMDNVAPGPFAPDIRWRTRAINFVEQWNPARIDGQAALTQRICKIPSQDATRFHWEQYEATKCSSTGLSSVRCLVALPLFDADGSVMAVIKLINRKHSADGHSGLEFTRSDITTLSAFSAVFACILPYPYLGLPGTGLARRPQAAIKLSDTGVSAVVSWQIPQGVQSNALVHELLSGEVPHEDEYVGTALSKDDWTFTPCGILESCGGWEGEKRFEFEVANLKPNKNYAFSVRLRNSLMSVDWSEPSAKLSTYLVPPYSLGNEVVQLFPTSENSVQLEWVPFHTCDHSLRYIEYRIVASTQGGVDSQTSLGEEGKDQIVGIQLSDGMSEKETAVVSNLQTNLVYTFYIEARYPYVGTREFTRVLVSERFFFPTVDITLPPPQPLASDVAMASAQLRGQTERPLPIFVRWPYPPDLSPQLALQYRTACVAQAGSADGLRLHVSPWSTVRPGDMVPATVVHDEVATEVQVLRDPALSEKLAVQLRVVMMPHGSHASPPSVWFHPDPPAAPESARTELVCSDADGVSLQVDWFARRDTFEGAGGQQDGSARELGPVGYSVRHDFSRGNGPAPTRLQVRIRAVSAEGDPRSDWEELPARLLPPAIRQSVQQAGGLSSLNGYRILLNQHRHVTQVGVVFELHLRLGNALFWSRWAQCGVLRMQVAPPSPVPGDSLSLEEVRDESVRLCWQPFSPAEARLQALEYKVMCLELPDASDARPENGGRMVAWRAVDTLVMDADANVGVTAPLRYTVRSLLPSRRYLFAIECRYVGLPESLATHATARLEAAGALACRDLRLSMLPDNALAEVVLVQRSSQQHCGPHGFNLRLEWLAEFQPTTARVPHILCYQLCCVPHVLDYSDAVPAKLLLPPALMTERNRADSPANFLIDRSRGVISATVEFSASTIDSSVSRLPLSISARVGDPSTGQWSGWSDGLGETVRLALAPPVPSLGDELQLREDLWERSCHGAPPLTTQHAVAGVTIAWKPFQAAETTPVRQHAHLIVQYEVSVWCLEPSVANSEEVRRGLQTASASVASTEARMVYRKVVAPEALESEAGAVHSLRIPGDSLQSMRFHFFRVAAQYFFMGGVPVPEPMSAEGVGGPAVLVSAASYRPSPHQLPPPQLGSFPIPYDESPERCAVLVLPNIERDTEPLIVECRSGCVFTSSSETETTVVPSGDWVVMPKESQEELLGDKPRLLLRNLQASICQFRLRRGAAESEPSGWVDTTVWRPEVVGGPHLGMQMRGRCRQGLQGLGVALGVSHDSSLFALLAWPRQPVENCAVQIQRYQVRYRNPGGLWTALPMVDLPRGVDPSAASPTVECQVNELAKGETYEFSVRLCNALSRWSEWSAVTRELPLAIPAPGPNSDSEARGVRLAMVTTTAVKLVWAPFSVPCREEAGDVPLLLTEADEVHGALPAEYELAVREEGSGGVVSISQMVAAVLFDELPADGEAPWLEADVVLEPHKSYTFGIRSRLRSGQWGPSLVSPVLPPRLQAIAVGTPLVDLLLVPGADSEAHLEAALRVECGVRGFWSGDSRPEHVVELDRKAARLKRCQVRLRALHRSLRPADAGEEASSPHWLELIPLDASSYYSPAEHLVQFNLPMHAITAPLSPGTDYVFSVRCQDEYDRWTAWSASSEPLPPQAPALAAPQPERQDGGANLRMTPEGPKAVLLEWAQFRPQWGGLPSLASPGMGTVPTLHKGLEAALQRIVYRLRMGKRLANSVGDWVSVPIAEITCDRRERSTVSYEVRELDERYEYCFYLAARWLDVPPVLGSQEWIEEVSSPMLPHRLPELRSPEAPRVEVIATEAEGLALQLRWSASPALRSSNGAHPLEGARYQLRYMVVQMDAPPSGTEPVDYASLWHTRPPVLEDEAEAVSSFESVTKLQGLSAGTSYRVSVRLGDAHRWSPWSAPTDPVPLALAPPLPSPGDLLEVTNEPGAVDALRLEWRNFRAAAGLGNLEYKIMVLEWPSEEARDGGVAGGSPAAPVQAPTSHGNAVMARLSQAAELARSGGGADSPSPPLHGGVSWPSTAARGNFRTVGYISRRNAAAAAPGLAAELSGARRVEWRTEGLRPGMYYRFFVCARYASLPAGSLLLPAGGDSEATPSLHAAAAQGSVWLDEYFENWRLDNDTWQAALSRFGLWSSVVNTLHLPQYMVRPVSSLGSTMATAGLTGISSPGRPLGNLSALGTLASGNLVATGGQKLVEKDAWSGGAAKHASPPPKRLDLTSPLLAAAETTLPRSMPVAHVEGAADGATYPELWLRPPASPPMGGLSQ
eukprot:TRINITY_DN17616_c0_g3_i1.p1 TRINITY_DN17616_c0_g3~~TRINITY_DN17616_c0_g3_i1.p1  ORF type:complete len:2468 (-),score=493.74 TRINITY_DN17616_c0_g3_i1:65-7468(-)